MTMKDSHGVEKEYEKGCMKVPGVEKRIDQFEA